MKIQLKKMEELEKKYNIALHIEQLLGEKDRYYEIGYVFPFVKKQKTFLGHTLEEVEENLIKRYKS